MRISDWSSDVCSSDLIGLRPLAAPIAAQVGYDQGEGLRKARRDPVPHDMGLGIAVQEQERWSLAALAEVDLRLAYGDPPIRKSLEHADRPAMILVNKGFATSGAGRMPVKPKTCVISGRRRPPDPSPPPQHL